MKGQFSYKRKFCNNAKKVCFYKKDALSKKNQLHRLGREKYLRAYHCPFCNFWHLTKRRKHHGNH